MSKIPKTVKVGPFVVSVKNDSLTWFKDGGDGFLGFCNFSAQEVYIQPALPPQQQADTLWHEIKHTIHRMIGKRAEDELKIHEAIEMFSSLELMILRENPELVSYLLDPE